MNEITPDMTRAQEPMRIDELVPAAADVTDEELALITGGMLREKPGGGTTYLGPDTSCWDPVLP